jgi:hypothetical protein
LLKIKRANPVVTKVQREDEHGDMQIFDDRSAVDGEIARYFAEIYKRPEFRRLAPNEIDFNVDGEELMQIDTSSRVNASDSGDNVTAFTRRKL